MLETALIFILAAAVLLALEIFIPSGGLIAIGSLLCAVIGIGFLFATDWQYGLIATVLLLILAPIGFAFFLKIMPYMPVTRSLTLRSRQQANATNYDPSLKNAESELIGAEGKAMTDLRPVGTCLINDKRIECLAATGMIESGHRIKVISVDGIEIKVKPL